MTQQGQEGAAPGGGRTAGRVVVGVDGSPGARAALVWALAAAARSGAVLELVSAHPVDFSWTDAHLLDTRRRDEIREEVREDTETRVRGVLAEARQDPALSDVPGVADVAAEVVALPGPPAEHLLARAAGARVLVVGSRGRGGVRSTLLGSVALHCAVHAPCPVVVVHPGAVQPPPRVVVGIEDSAMSRAALARAAEEARERGAELEVLAVHQPDPYWTDMYAVAAPPLAESVEAVRDLAGRIVGEVLGADADVRLRVEAGAAADRLLRAADGAALLVVGSHSTSRLAAMLLGSIALHCALHAPCPVMVVHPEPAGAPFPDAAVAAAEAAPVPAAG
ncbi:universal stress protein [Trujillonella humicola]|uniref:universal stress protein n=1 Tax=Trujillonella humicola TaxID=3383699 RepID=UPI0039064F59